MDSRGVDGDLEGRGERWPSVGRITWSWITSHHPHMMPEIAVGATEQTSRRALR